MPKKLDFSKRPTDAFMAQFQTIAEGPVNSAGFIHAGSASISVGKVGGQVLVESSLSDITN